MKGVEGLSGTEAGFVVGAALLGTPGTTDRLMPEDAEPCAAALQALAGVSAPDRSRQVAALMDEWGSPVPRGLERVHPGWLREVMEAESTSVLRAVTAGLPAGVREVAAQIISARGEDPERDPADAVSDAALADLRRAVFGGFVALPPDAHAVSPDALAARGAAVLGRSLQGAPREVVARAAAGVGEPWARSVIEAAGAGAQGDRDQARALVASIRSEDLGLGAVHAIGLYALDAELAGASDDVRLAIAQQLPPALGRILLRGDSARGED